MTMGDYNAAILWVALVLAVSLGLKALGVKPSPSWNDFRQDNAEYDPADSGVWISFE